MRKAFALALLLLSATAAAADLDLRQLIRTVEDQHTGRSSQARLTLQVSTAHWQRNLEMEAWSLGRDYFLVRILAPAKERGVATLKAEKDVWNYLPRVDRVIKVPPSLMGGSWMGSHITNNDLVKAAHIDQDYDFTLLAETADSYTIEGLPKPDAAVIWGRIVYSLQKQPLAPTRVAYYDEQGRPVREIRFEDLRSTGGHTVPFRMVVQPLDKPDEQTLLQYEQLQFDLPLDRAYFSLRNLKGG